jgi:hypothetical protein
VWTCLDCCAHAGATGANDYDVVLVVDDVLVSGLGQFCPY